MTGESSIPHYIIVLGTGYSGSGALFDYLAGRPDCHTPFGDVEFILPQMPYGLMYLEAMLGDYFHYTAAEWAIRNFERQASLLARAPSLFRYGKDFDRRIIGFSEEAKKFCSSLVRTVLPFEIDLDRSNETNFKRVYNRSVARVIRRRAKSPHGMRMPVNKNTFIHNTKMFVQNLIDRSGRSSAGLCVLNQAGSGWNPFISTRYFPNRQVIVVLRDPRDQYSELKKFKGCNDVEAFCKWYMALMEMKAAQNEQNNLVSYIYFEELVDRGPGVICERFEECELTESIESTYDLRRSKKNVGIFKCELSRSECKVIERNLSEYFLDL